MAGCYASAFYNNPSDLLQRFKEKSGISNFPSWYDADYQNSVSAISHTNKEGQDRLVKQAASILTHQTPYIPVYNCSMVYAKHPQLHGEIFDAGGCVDFRFSFLEK